MKISALKLSIRWAFYFVQALKTLKAMEVQAFIHVKRYGRSNKS
nr:MAG TPA: hypothetical protein [Caudoviricetes sp.]